MRKKGDLTDPEESQSEVMPDKKRKQSAAAATKGAAPKPSAHDDSEEMAVPCKSDSQRENADAAPSSNKQAPAPKAATAKPGKQQAPPRHAPCRSNHLATAGGGGGSGAKQSLCKR